ncbi:hypothetical protein [Paracoccus tegillarcae]|uniref:DUF2946 domain-containing protein n=1 Tax=Paracoccus tegillarcae TaxID=1529068 RepID=A0A2K9EDS9_9RHOB|nr:hypothetical protein [Paracoccus tegillarcae]AUH33100.1 hypothetical protein CUV01_06590 [Paracoccus tegillarcae]
MRLLLSALLSVMLAVTMPLVVMGASAEASPMASMAATSPSPTAHECCTTQPDSPHGDCAACAALGHTEVTPDAARSPRRIRHIPPLVDMKSARPRFPLPPPRSAAL